MKYLIPLIAAYLFRKGGSDQQEIYIKIKGKKLYFNQKLWRWLIGIPIGVLFWKGWVAFLLTVLTYFIATNVFGYGEKNPVTGKLPEPIKHAVSGLAFGLASIPLLGWVGLIQGAIGALMFWVIWEEDARMKIGNPWVEWFRGFFGTCVFFFI